MGQIGPSAEQQARSRMFYAMASIASVVLVISGTALGIAGNTAGWVLVAFAVAMWLGLYLTLKYTRKAQP
ncbi:hypothetical protein ACWGDT_19835 [Streptomyces avermitilis]